MNVFVKNRVFFLRMVISFLMFFCMITGVDARVLTIESVAEQFGKTDIVKEFISLGGEPITAQVNSIDKTLDISNDEKLFSLVYGDDYIEYSDYDTVITKENYDKDFNVMIYLANTLETILDLSGYEDKNISNYYFEGNNSYDIYGMEFETERYSFNDEYENGGYSNISGDYTRYFKISLDTDKIDKLILDYGIDRNMLSREEVLLGREPVIEAKNVTENSVTLYAKILDSYDPRDVFNCYIYRSDSEDGVYEKISDFAVNCSNVDGEVGLVDEGLKSNTTYYYKTIIDGGDNYSDVIKVTTSGSAIENTTNHVKEENPKTGKVSSSIIIGLMFICSFIAIFCVKKNVYN